MTDREKYLTILDRFYRGRGGSLLTKDESEAIEYAISSIKTDLKYDLLYEETKHIANVSKKIESTPDDCETCIHNKGVLECDMYGCKYKPKNDLGVDSISRIETIDYLCKHCPDDGECFKDCDEIKHLRQMPSVTPQEPILDKITEIIEPLRHKCLDEMSDIEWQILRVIDKYKAETEEV